MKRFSAKALALLAMTAVLLAALTTAALAAPADVDIASGSITIGDGTYAQGTGEEAPIPEGGLVITGTSDSNTIIVDPGDGETAAFTIDGLTLSTESGARLIDVQSGGAEITLSGENTLTGGGAGALIRVSKGQALTIKGSGSLELSNGTTGKAAHGAAIGGSVSEDGGTINIGSGNITIVQYGPGAGIGGGGPNAETSGTGDSGDITISGGNIDITVTAVDNYGGGCGIGPGMNYYTTPSFNKDGVLNSITISGGTVKSESNSAVKNNSVYCSGAAIGTGRMGSSGDSESIVHITGNANVIAIADTSAAIGGSSCYVANVPVNGYNATILIDNNAVVLAETRYKSALANNRKYNGAAIGHGNGNFITWNGDSKDDAQVTANGGLTGAGIGGSMSYPDHNTKMTITIGGNAVVEASSVDYAAGIGGSFYFLKSPDDTVITIKDTASKRKPC